MAPLDGVPLTARIRDVRAASDDPHYLQTMPLILEAFPQVTVRAYWDLTVEEHISLVAHLFGDADAEP